MGIMDRFLGAIGDKKPVDDGTGTPGQPQDDKAIVSFIQNKIQEVRQSASRVSSEGVWMTNIAYVLGFSSVYYDAASRQFKTVGKSSSPLKRSRVHVNKILPTIQNRLARLCKSPPKYDVRPNSNDTDDKDAARLALQILNAKWDDLKINRKRIDLIMWAQQCGIAYLKVYWNPAAGKPMVDPMTGQAGKEGDIEVDVISPFEVFQDPLAKTMDEVSWLCHARVRKLNYFRERYPEKGAMVKEEGAWLLSLQYQMRINSLNSSTGSSGGTAQTQMKDSAIEVTYYEKPSDKFPKGRQIAIANGIKLEEKELACGEIPFVKFDDITVSGKFYSEALVTHLRPIQDQYNRLIAARADWTNKLLNGKYIAARGSGIAQEAMNDRSGEIVYYTPVPNAPNGGMPVAMQMPVIPQYAYLEEEKLNNMILDISGINEVSRGQLPSASIPYAGMQLLQEQDETRLGIMTECHEESYALVGSLILKYVQQYYQLPRIFKQSGSNSEYMIKEFVGADIKENDDVIVIRGSTIPNSKVLKRQEILNLYSQGFYGDPQDSAIKSKIMDMLEYGDVGESWKSIALRNNQIKEVIEQLEQGQIPTPMEFDDKALWLRKLDEYRLSDKYKKLDPQHQANVIYVMNMCVQAMMPQNMINNRPQMLPEEKTFIDQSKNSIQNMQIGGPDVPEAQPAQPQG